MSLVEGYLYLITNSAWPGWIKVGTTKNIKHRVRSYQTGSPFRDYQVVYSVKHPDYLLAEKRIRQQMEYFASDIRNEWFKVDLQIAKDRLVEQLDNYFYGECDQSQKYNNYKYEKQVELV